MLISKRERRKEGRKSGKGNERRERGRKTEREVGRKEGKTCTYLVRKKVDFGLIPLTATGAHLHNT